MLVSVAAVTTAAIATGAWLRWAVRPVMFAFRLGRMAATLADRRNP